MAEDAPFEPGDRIGSYVVESVLGRGGIGTVYRGRHAHMDRGAAISVLTRPEWAESWYRGASLLSGLDHPNIVRLYDIGEERGFPFLALEYVEGEPLSSLTNREGTIETRVLLRLMSSVAGALQHAHENGVLHKAIAASNIVIGRSGEPVLTDFAFAAPAAGDTSFPENKLIGIPFFMSPEHWHDSCRPESDIWSLGVVLYELLTGRTPHEGDSTFGVLRAIATEPPVSITEHRSDLPAEVVRLLETMLARSPDDRPTARAASESLSSR